MLNKDKIRQILALRFEKDIHRNLCDLPLPTCFKDIYKAALRIKKAIDNNEKIAIVGDYDVDGVISCVIVSEFFEDIGFDYIIKIPNRFKDGYGLNTDIVKDLIEQNVSLIITVDNGIAAFEAGELCKQKGIDLIITDHHTPQNELPQAFAIINPKQKDCDFPNIEICGAQVAWYLIATLKVVCNIQNYAMNKFIGLLAIAIVADMMELRDLNRALVREGIKIINASKRPAFSALKEYFQKESFELDHIGFLIAPLLNSSGRMDDANLSFDFLKAKNIQKAKEYLEQIIQLNNERKEEEKSLFEQSLQNSCKDEDIILVSGKDWHEGVLGIVASRLAKHFNKPAFVFSEFDDKLKGSARSVGRIDILSLIEPQKDLLLAFGGHKGAAGLSLKRSNLELFKKNLILECKKLNQEDFLNNDELLGELDISEVDFELLEILQSFEPFGHKNPRPFFQFNKLLIKHIKKIGKDSNHIKLVLSKDNVCIEALFFNYTKELQVGDELSVIASVSRNAYRGLVSPQLIIKELL